MTLLAISLLFFAMLYSFSFVFSCYRCSRGRKAGVITALRSAGHVAHSV